MASNETPATQAIWANPLSGCSCLYDDLEVGRKTRTNHAVTAVFTTQYQPLMIIHSSTGTMGQIGQQNAELALTLSVRTESYVSYGLR